MLYCGLWRRKNNCARACWLVAMRFRKRCVRARARRYARGWSRCWRKRWRARKVRGRRRFRPRGGRALMRRARARRRPWPCSRRCAARWTRGRSSRRRTRTVGTCASPAWCARSLQRAGRGRRVARARTKQAGRRCRASRGRETCRECRASRGLQARRADGGQRAKRATRAGRP